MTTLLTMVSLTKKKRDYQETKEKKMTQQIKRRKARNILLMFAITSLVVKLVYSK